MSLTPEALARQQIDAQLVAAGWTIQDYKAVDFSAGRGIALREVPLKTGPCDYLLLVDRHVVGVIEAKKEGTTLSAVAEQSARYASSLPDFLAAGLTGSLPFAYESTGVETFFRDERDPAPRSRRVFAFHRPETLAAVRPNADPPPHVACSRPSPFAHPLSALDENLTFKPFRLCRHRQEVHNRLQMAIYASFSVSYPARPQSTCTGIRHIRNPSANHSRSIHHSSIWLTADRGHESDL